MSSDTATIVYSYFFVAAALLAGMGMIAKHTIVKYTEELKDKLNRIEYALYNDGKTGLINKVEELLENQQLIKIDVEVMKAKSEQ
jgi:ABC-type amino acid transport substrate-binding protein